jgi:hypothetical protein
VLKPLRIVIAALIGLGPLALAVTLYLVTFSPGNASGGAGFWLAVALFLTPGFLALAYYFYTGRR